MRALRIRNVRRLWCCKRDLLSVCLSVCLPTGCTFNPFRAMTTFAFVCGFFSAFSSTVYLFFFCARRRLAGQCELTSCSRRWWWCGWWWWWYMLPITTSTSCMQVKNFHLCCEYKFIYIYMWTLRHTQTAAAVAEGAAGAAGAAGQTASEMLQDDAS